jgi:hypothetical protein
LELGSEALLRELPLEAREEIGPDIHPKICRPGGVTLEVAGKMRGDWTAHWYYDAEQMAVRRIGATEPDSRLKVHPKSRGSLRGFTYVEARVGAAHPLGIQGIKRLASRFDGFYGALSEGSQTSLTLTALTWGADAELRLLDPPRPDIPFSQTFIHPRSDKTLLHGYRVKTEGVRLHLNSDRLTISSIPERQRRIVVLLFDLCRGRAVDVLVPNSKHSSRIRPT